MLYPYNFLRRYRLAAGLSQREVADILGLTRADSISRWERGMRVPNPVRLLELSCLYRRLVNDLLRPQYLVAQKRIAARRQEVSETSG